MTYVRRDDVCVSSVISGYYGEPGRVRLSVFDWDTGDRLPGDGMVFDTTDESRDYAFSMGYLVEYTGYHK